MSCTMLLDGADIVSLFAAIDNIAVSLERATASQSSATQPEVAHTIDGSSRSHRRPGLTLPRSCSGQVEAELRELGRTLRGVAGNLRKEVDSQLVTFYNHMKSKEMTELEVMATNRQIVPEGFHATQMGSNDTSSAYMPRAPSRRLSRRPRHSKIGIDAVLPRLEASTSGAAASLVSKAAEASLSGSKGILAASGTAGAGKSTTTTTLAASTHRNAPLQRRLHERRLAATAMQSFLYLLLECALTQAEATCAAVYMNSMKLSEDDSFKIMDCPPDFLHNVAHVNATGKLPSDVSYASSNTLVTVVETGVALNLCNSNVQSLTEDAAAIVGSSDGKSTKRADTNHRVLNINSGIIVPIRNYGCVVIANKRSSAAAAGSSSFSTMDEHIAWSLASTCDALLTRYKRELLQQASWTPIAAQHLNRFMLQPPIGAAPHRDSDVSGKASSVVAFMSARKNDGPVSKALTIVRTEDPRMSKAVPSASMPHRRTQKEDSINEEDLFEGAAQYIKNLESLWLQSIHEKNTMQTMADHYMRELETKEEKMSSLEANVRRLNARVAHLERSQSRAT